jgi:hypothetical protein
MINTNRITTVAAVLLTLAVTGAQPASARPTDYMPPGKTAPAPAYSRPDKEMTPTSQPATSSDSIGQAGALRSLTQQQRERVAGISALSDRQLAAAFGAAPPAENQPNASPAVVRAQTPENGFDWGDACVGALGGLVLAMLGFGAGLVISQRRTRPTTTLPN